MNTEALLNRFVSPAKIMLTFRVGVPVTTGVSIYLTRAVLLEKIEQMVMTSQQATTGLEPQDLTLLQNELWGCTLHAQPLGVTLPLRETDRKLELPHPTTAPSTFAEPLVPQLTIAANLLAPPVPMPSTPSEQGNFTKLLPLPPPKTAPKGGIRIRASDTIPCTTTLPGFRWA